MGFGEEYYKLFLNAPQDELALHHVVLNIYKQAETLNAELNRRFQHNKSHPRSKSAVADEALLGEYFSSTAVINALLTVNELIDRTGGERKGQRTPLTHISSVTFLGQQLGATELEQILMAHHDDVEDFPKDVDQVDEVIQNGHLTTEYGIPPTLVNEVKIMTNVYNMIPKHIRDILQGEYGTGFNERTTFEDLEIEAARLLDQQWTSEPVNSAVVETIQTLGLVNITGPTNEMAALTNNPKNPTAAMILEAYCGAMPTYKLYIDKMINYVRGQTEESLNRVLKTKQLDGHHNLVDDNYLDPRSRVKRSVKTPHIIRSAMSFNNQLDDVTKFIMYANIELGLHKARQEDYVDFSKVAKKKRNRYQKDLQDAREGLEQYESQLQDYKNHDAAAFLKQL